MGNSFYLSGDEHKACIAPGTHFISGLVNYYSLTGDMRALNAAEDCVDRFLCRFDDFCDKYANPDGFNYMERWIVEGLPELYRKTKNEKYLETVRRIAFECLGLLEGSHSHGYMTTLRGILKAAAYSGDDKLAELVSTRRKEIIDKGATLFFRRKEK